MTLGSLLLHRSTGDGSLKTARGQEAETHEKRDLLNLSHQRSDLGENLVLKESSTEINQDVNLR